VATVVGRLTEPAFGLSCLSAGDLSIGEEIGKGRFKRVVEGTLRSSSLGDECDVVVLQYVKSGEKRELQVLTMLAKNTSSCPFVPEIYGAIDEGPTMLIVQERAHWGSMKAALSGTDGVHFTFEHKLHGSTQISRAMAFLESMRIVHADLSCRNILLCKYLQEDPSCTLVKVTDFGLAVVLKEGADSEIRKQPQATRWCAPETVAHSKFSHRSDVWSLGTTLWELFSGGAVPWVRWQRRSNVGARLRTLADIAAKGGSENISEDFPAPCDCNPAAHSAMLACLQVDERARPGFAQLVEDFALIVEEVIGARGGGVSDDELKASEEVSPAQAAEAGMGDLPDSILGCAVGLQADKNDELQNDVSAKGDPDRKARRQSGWETPSTSATPTIPWPQSDGLEVALEPLSGTMAATYAEALRELLHSPRVLELLGDKAGLEALKEFLSAPQTLELLASEAREDHLVEFIRERTPQASLEDDDAKQSCRTSKQSPGPNPKDVGPLRDVMVPLYPYGMPASSQKSGVWTLLSLVSPKMLRRRDFSDEADAWAAFHANGSSPCMLRDPCGTDVASRSWLVVGSQPTNCMTAREGASPLVCMPGLTWSASTLSL